MLQFYCCFRNSQISLFLKNNKTRIWQQLSKLYLCEVRLASFWQTDNKLCEIYYLYTSILHTDSCPFNVPCTAKMLQTFRRSPIWILIGQFCDNRDFMHQEKIHRKMLIWKHNVTCHVLLQAYYYGLQLTFLLSFFPTFF